MTQSNASQSSIAATSSPATAAYDTFGGFVSRHIGPSAEDRQKMLATLGADSLQALMAEVVPSAILSDAPMDLEPNCTEQEALAAIKAISSKNELFTSRHRFDATI